MIGTYNCIFHIYKGHQNLGVLFMYDIITPLSMIFYNDKMPKHFILDLFVKYVVIFWHLLWPRAVSCSRLIFNVVI